MSPLLIDTHAHLHDARLGPAGHAPLRDTVVRRALQAGVTHIVCCGTREEDWDAVLETARRYPDVVPMLGLHPWHVREACSSWLTQLRHLLRDGRAGVGECGLDFALEDPDRELQERVFRAQLALACELDLPVSIHCRRAWAPLAAAAREVGLPPAGAVVHAFSGSPETALELQALGFHLAFGCSLAHPDNRRGPQALRAVRADRLHFETDAPDLPPRHLPEYAEGRPNEPANVALVLEAAARLRDEAQETLAAQVHANGLAVFGRIRT